MIRSDSAQQHAEATYKLTRIARGDFYADLPAWRRAAAALDAPILAELDTDIHNSLEPEPAWADKALTNINGGRWPAVIGFYGGRKLGPMVTTQRTPRIFA